MPWRFAQPARLRSKKFRRIFFFFLPSFSFLWLAGGPWANQTWGPEHGKQGSHAHASAMALGLESPAQPLYGQ
jgi:hypothetical protein